MTIVSAVIPAYNAARYIGQALGSIKEQRRPVDEIVVVDDCSTDDTVAIATSYGARCLSTGKNGGPGRARNVGLAQARGDIVTFLDSDDWWDPEHTEVVVGLLERFPESAVAFSGARSIGMEELQSTFTIPGEEALDIFWPLVQRNLIPQLAVAARREVLLAAGGYEESMRWAEDYDLWLRLSRRHKFVCSHRITVNYRSHDGQTTTQHPKRLLHGTCLARYRLYRAIEREEPALRQRLALELLGAWERDLKNAWRNRDREFIEAGLAIADLVPESDTIAQDWRLRMRLAWPLWSALGGVWKVIPGPARSALKDPLLRLTGLD